MEGTWQEVRALVQVFEEQSYLPLAGEIDGEFRLKVLGGEVNERLHPTNGCVGNQYLHSMVRGRKMLLQG